MKKHLSAPFALAGVAALVVSSLLVTATPAQAVVPATVVVNIVDQYGHPSAGAVSLYDSTGTQYNDGPGGGGLPIVATTHTFVVPEGGYSMVNIGPWSGVDCEGAAPCGITGPTSFTPVVTASAAAPASHTMHVTVPSITGGPKVGSPLTIQIPPSLALLQAVYSGIPGLPSASANQWVRGTTDVPGATGTSYTTTPADGGQAMTARLMPPFGMSIIFSSLGYTIPPFTTAPITMSKYKPVKTKTKVTVPTSVGANERVSMKVKVTSKIGDPDGMVVIRIGKFRTKKALKKGSFFLTLPQLSVGTHTITTKYGGSLYFAKSKAKNVTISVHS